MARTDKTVHEPDEPVVVPSRMDENELETQITYRDEDTAVATHPEVAESETTVEVDFVLGEDERGRELTEQKTLLEMVDGLALTASLIAKRGPAGGNPHAYITGPRSQVVAFLRRHSYDGQLEELGERVDV